MNANRLMGWALICSLIAALFGGVMFLMLHPAPKPFHQAILPDGSLLACYPREGQIEICVPYVE